METIKKSSRYFSLTLIKTDTNQVVTFRDVLNFSSPTTLDNYLKQWGATVKKGIFPYGEYSSVEELRSAVEFPPFSAFYSELRQTNVAEEDYKEAKAEFQRRESLPVWHSEKWESMASYMEWYNMCDTAPLVEAINNSFTAFHQYFDVDANSHASLPSMAFDALFKDYPTSMAYVFTFNNAYDDIRRWFRENLLGGLTTVFHRHLDLTNDHESPLAARVTPDGSLLTSMLGADANAMYVDCQQKPMPLGHGLLWTPDGSKFRKKIMTSGCSLGQLEWINYMELEDEVQIQHAYHRGEVTTFGVEYQPDGYALVDGQHNFYEYLGMYSLCVIDRVITHDSYYS